MKATKIPTDCILSDKEMKCLKTYNERQRRQFLASKADSMGCHGVNYVCNAIGVCRDTLYRGKHELDTDANASFPMDVSGKSVEGELLHWRNTLSILTFWQNCILIYCGLAARRKRHLANHISTSNYRVVQGTWHQSIQIYRQSDEKARGFKERSFVKALTLKDVKDRNAQFEKIQKVRSECESNNIPIFSIDTKKRRW